MSARTYRLPPPDRTGWLLGLGPGQLIPLGVGLGLAVLVVARTGSAGLGAAPLALGAAVALTRTGGLPLVEAAPVAAGWVRRRRHRRFEAPVPVAGPQPDLPDVLSDQEILVVHRPGADLAVVADRRGFWSATLRIATSSPFLLATRAEQERLLAGFGDALSSLCRERGAVVSLRWSSFAAPAPMADPDADGPAASSYAGLLDHLSGMARHEALVTLTLSAGRAGDDETRLGSVAAALDLLTGRLTEVGFDTAPLSPPELAAALRKRLDPATRPALRRHRSLAEAAGLVTPATSGPSCAEEHWGHWQVDGSVHRAYHVLTWPRVEVPPDWLADFLLVLPTPRLFCLVFEPVPPRVSRRALDREAARLDSDEEQRRRAGFRVGAEHEAARGALSSREAEFAAGFPEVDYAGLLVLSAGDLRELDEREEQALSAAAAAGVELAPLAGRHAAGLGACLPLARALAPRTRR